MGKPEKDRKIDPNSKEDAPQLGAILPDDLPPAAAELVGDLDNYQRRMEREWEKAKSSYEHKINHIMEEFMRAGMAGLAEESATEGPAEPAPVPPPKQSKTFASFEPDETPKRAGSRDARLARLMSEMERELTEASRKTKRGPFVPHAAPESLQLPWSGAGRFSLGNWKDPKKIVAAVLIFLAAGGLFYANENKVRVTNLPYAHTLGPIVWKGNIYVMDWFRKALYIHEDKLGLPIRSVEPVANNFATGLAMSEKTFWTLDALDKKILLHTVTPDHQITGALMTPEAKPIGLFYDGTDIWTADQDARKIYRLRGNDLEDIRDTFPLPELTVTAIALNDNRLWILDGKSRLITVYRLQKPLLLLGSFDLDPFVKGAMPTGMAFQGRKILVVTENPATLTRIPISRLKKSRTETTF